MTFTNKTIYLSLWLLLVLLSCDREMESEGVSKVTTYPTFDFKGDEAIYVEAGTPYVEPGVTATEGGIDIEVKTEVHGTYFVSGVPSLDTSIPDIYTIDYLATNSDGFDGVVSRTVYIAGKGDLVNDISGLYTSTVVRNGVSGAQYTDMEYVIISKTGSNTYEISDAIGGYYDLGRAYGPDYIAPGVTITANNIAADNFSFSDPVGVGPFGGEVVIQSMDVDAASKTIVINSVWQADPETVFNFLVTLKQVDF